MAARKGREAPCVAGRAAYTEDERTGSVAMTLAYDNSDTRASHVGPMEYYTDSARGGVREWTNAFAVMSWGPWLDFAE
jgi:hypothetical protein